MSTLPARLLILFLLVVPCSVEAGAFVVDTTADDPALTACDDAAPNDCSLRGAILAANERPLSEASTINVPAGTYVLSQVSPCTFSVQPDPTTFFTLSHIPLCLSKHVTIQGAGADTTIIDGDQRVRVLFVSASAVAELRGVTIANGRGDRSFGNPALIAPPHGGGIMNEGTLTLSDSVVTDSSLELNAGGAAGAGIYNAGVLTLLRSSVSDNVSPTNDQGGGIFNAQQAVLSLSDSTISGNVIASNGGGICNAGGSVTITNSTVSGNTALGFGGGGIANFSGNIVATLMVTNSTISGNFSGSSGGGILASGPTHLNNVTITNNTGGTDARGSGGGVSGGVFIFQNTVIAGNRDATTAVTADCGTGTQLTSQGYNLIQNTVGCVVTGDSTGNLTGVDPKLGVLADNGGLTQTHGLSAGSLAIDAGNPAAPGSGGAACAAADQRGLLRPVGTTCDIGAFERSTTLSLAKILPNSGGNDGSVIALLSGGGFAPAATSALLRRAGHADIIGSPVAAESGGAVLTTTFDLTGADLGSWDVVVTNPDLTSVTLSAGFTVETPQDADLFAVVVARSSARPGLPARFAVLYGNRGNTDALGVPLTLGLPAAFARRFSVEVAAPPAQPGQPFDDYSDVPLEVTAPAASDQADIPLLIPIVPAGFTGLLAFTLTPPAGTSGTDFDIEAFIGTPWFTNGTVRPDIVAEAAARAREFAANRLGVTAGQELDPALIAYETAALGLAVALSRDELVDNFGQIRGVFSLAYFAIDLAGYATAQTMASAALPPRTWLAALPQWLTTSFGLVPNAVTAQTVCPPCNCANRLIAPGCIDPCGPDDCKPEEPKTPKKPPPGISPADCNDLPKHVVSADGKTCKPTDSKNCPKGFGSPFSTDPFCRTYPINGSFDPNDKAGSGGSGPEHFVPPSALIPYVIAFENLPAATAAAQTVVVTDQLDTQMFDLDSFTLGPILVGDMGLTPPPGLATFSGGADLRPAHNVVVRVDAALDKATGIVTWRFTSLDPSTLETLTDPDEGFLPPNINPPAGDAQVHFTILPKPGLATGTEIRNHARVVFDTNAPIDTPEWLNTVDTSVPTSQVLPLASTQPSASFLVEWVGTDDGAGILDYSIFVSVDGGPFSAFLTNTTDTSAMFSGEVGKRYAFYSIARDSVGNEEGPPTSPDTATRVGAQDCAGDCNHDGKVKVNELITGVSIALGRASISDRPSFDETSNDHIEVSELVRGVNNLLRGCRP